MGYTQFSKHLVSKAISQVIPRPTSVLDFGACLDYSKPEAVPINNWYKELGIEYTAIDLAGDNGALQINWGYYPILEKIGPFDLVCDFGSSEHTFQNPQHTITAFDDGKINSIYAIQPPTEDEINYGYFCCWLNKVDMLRTGGIMINENPMTKHWPGHGYSYLNADFYERLAEISGLEVIESGVHFATGNTETGGNVYSILKKVDGHFPTSDEFYDKLPIFRS